MATRPQWHAGRNGVCKYQRRSGQILALIFLPVLRLVSAPVLNASISIAITADKATSKCVVGNYTFEVEMSGFSAPYLINREPAAMPPFHQQGVEIHAQKSNFKN